MRNKPVFVDTHILFYAYDTKAGEKHTKAKKLVAELWAMNFPPSISIQVLQELFVTLLKRGAAAKVARDIIDDYSSWNIMDNNYELLQAGIGLQEKYRISFWDALIISAAKAANADMIYTEDLNHGQKYEGITALNPFR